MSLTDFSSPGLFEAPVPEIPIDTCVPCPRPMRPLHRIAEVRRFQGIPLAQLAKRLASNLETIQTEERPDCDMLLSRLYRWQAELNVPVGELLVDSDENPENPIRRRGQLIKVMKTARTLLENAQEIPMKIMAQTLCDQLIEIMPELAHIGPWPTVGQSRESKDMGQAAYRRFDANLARMLDQD